MNGVIFLKKLSKVGVSEKIYKWEDGHISGGGGRELSIEGCRVQIFCTLYNKEIRTTPLTSFWRLY